MDLHTTRKILTFGRSRNRVRVIKPRGDYVDRLGKGEYVEISYARGTEILGLTSLGGDMFDVVRYYVTNGKREEFSRTPHPIAPVNGVLNLSVGGSYKVDSYKVKDQERVELKCLREPTY